MENQKVDIDEMLANEVQVSTEDGSKDDILQEEIQKVEHTETEENIEYEYIYSGRAMNERELLRFSSKKPVQPVLIAGPSDSGKTTLMVMMYHLFREGRNRKFRFKGSRTMNGFWERSEKLLLNSGNKKAKMDHTSRSAQDLFLHLELVKENGETQNLIFSDISGELFSDQSFLKDLPDYYIDTKKLILIIDGAFIADVSKRRVMIHEIKVMADNLLKYRIMTENTNLQIVCTKMDKIALQDNNAECEEYIKVKYEELKNIYERLVERISFCQISALNLDDETECEKLEQIIEKCMEKYSVKKEIKEKNRRKLNRAFERYGLRG